MQARQYELHAEKSLNCENLIQHILMEVRAFYTAERNAVANHFALHYAGLYIEL